MHVAMYMHDLTLIVYADFCLSDTDRYWDVNNQIVTIWRVKMQRESNGKWHKETVTSKNPN